MTARELPTRRVATDAAWRALHQAASAPYRQAGRFAWHFARGKLGRDPVFRALIERGDLAAGSRVLDLGCGQGLLASLLAACGVLAQRAQWPAHWPAPPQRARYTGIELMPRDIARATAALAESTIAPRFICADMCSAELPASDIVVILDVLHYVDHAAQAELLARVRAALAPRGRLLLRVGDAGSGWRFDLTRWVDRMVTGLRGHRSGPTWVRSLPEWTQLLEQLGLRVAPLPMSQGTPFANVLLLCELKAAAP